MIKKFKNLESQSLELLTSLQLLKIRGGDASSENGIVNGGGPRPVKPK
jgi:hypothetical protein